MQATGASRIGGRSLTFEELDDDDLFRVTDAAMFAEDDSQPRMTRAGLVYQGLASNLHGPLTALGLSCERRATASMWIHIDRNIPTKLVVVGMVTADFARAWCTTCST